MPRNFRKLLESNGLPPTRNGPGKSRRSSFLVFAQNLLGEAETIDPDRNTAINRDLGQHRADLIGREPVLERATHVGLKLFHFSERRDHPKIEDRALAGGQRVVAPGLAPTILGDDALEIAVEVVDVVERAINVLLAEHRTALGEAAVVGVLVHHSSSFWCARPARAASRVSVAAFGNAALAMAA